MRLLGAVLILIIIFSYPITGKGDKGMTYNPKSEPLDRPPLDRERPITTETATFALG